MVREGTESLTGGPAAASRAPILRPGDRLGRYELVALIGRGGMGEVWAARQGGEFRFSRQVALKTIRPDLVDRPKLRAMFLDEARLASRIRHENVVEVYDLGMVDGWIFQALEYVDGMSLREVWNVLRGADLDVPLGIANRLVVDVCRGLHAAHLLEDDEGHPLHLVHRDVSPHNILVARDGVTKLTDFGIAKAAIREAPETDTGEFKGKLGYASPEHVLGTGIDHRADVASAAIVLWELISGRRLFQGNDPFDTMRRMRAWEIPNLTSERDVTAALAAVVARALERDPDHRYATASDFADAIEKVGPIASRSDVKAWLERLKSGDVESSADASGRVDVGEERRIASAIDEVRRRANESPNKRRLLIGAAIGLPALAVAIAIFRLAFAVDKTEPLAPVSLEPVATAPTPAATATLVAEPALTTVPPVTQPSIAPARPAVSASAEPPRRPAQQRKRGGPSNGPAAPPFKSPYE